MDDWKKLRDNYRSERVLSQIAWYNRKSGIDKQWYYFCQTIVIASGALIPLLVGYADGERSWLKFVAGGLGAAVVVAEGVLSLKKYRENWSVYRMTAERLQRELLLFDNAVGDDYAIADETAFKRFVIKAEQIMASENEEWNAYLAATGSTSAAASNQS
ncbi:MAG: DUF4231 domain-containing protein [Saprospiraceae bacterium]|nr:DUF4231 domain-containing protein [Saprospiraceae bacterium]